MKRFVWVNGQLVPEAKATIPVSNSAYLYGIGIFETLRARGGNILFFQDHLQRMQRNAQRIGLKLPLAQASLKKELRRLLKKNALSEATLRLMLSEDENYHPRLVMTAKPYEPYPSSCYEKGAKLIVARSVCADTKVTASIKTTSYLTKMIARREARKKKAHEALLVHENGFVTEGASSNIFIVKNGVLWTPPLPEGLLPGTRRKVVLALAKKLKIPVREKIFRASEIIAADEVFITSSLKDIMPVQSLDGKALKKPAPGPLTLRLMNAYEQKIS